MTRRDYCANCSEKVHDDDVMCGCGVSLCHDCVTPYDLSSEVCALIARINVLCNPTMTVGELNKLFQFYQTEKTYNTLLEFFELEKTTEIINNIKSIVLNYANFDETYEISLDDIENINKIVHNANHYVLEFVCNMCHENIKVEY